MKLTIPAQLEGSHVVVLVFPPMFSVARRMSNSKRANKRAKRMRVHAGAEMNT